MIYFSDIGFYGTIAPTFKTGNATGHFRQRVHRAIEEKTLTGFEIMTLSRPILFASVFLLSACAPMLKTHGNLPKMEKIHSLTPGEHTRNEVMDILGSPSSTDTFAGETWYYIGSRTAQTAFLKPEIVKRTVVAVSFADDGLLKSVRVLGKDHALPVKFVKKHTPTAGHNLTVMEQLLGNVGRFSDRNNP